MMASVAWCFPNQHDNGVAVLHRAHTDCSENATKTDGVSLYRFLQLGRRN